jgi:hypothetical protein
MQSGLKNDELVRFAWTVWAAAGSETFDAQLAFAWAIQHRRQAARRFACRTHSSHPHFGDGTLAAACRSALDDAEEAMHRGPCDMDRGPGAPPTDPTFYRSIAAACLVLSGEAADPIRGATRFHRHDQTPIWARPLEPVALIGQRFYYASRQ